MRKVSNNFSQIKKIIDQIKCHQEQRQAQKTVGGFASVFQKNQTMTKALKHGIGLEPIAKRKYEYVVKRSSENTPIQTVCRSI